ncbi:hypothetical protein CLF_104105, partial [Clonorchis sinensis]
MYLMEAAWDGVSPMVGAREISYKPTKTTGVVYCVACTLRKHVLPVTVILRRQVFTTVYINQSNWQTPYTTST